MARRKRKAKTRRRPPGAAYTTASYGRAVAAAIKRANRKRATEVPPLPSIPEWRPNRLRHQAATEVAERFDEGHAAAVLGNSRQMITQTYVKLLLAKAGKVAAAMG